jgi:hypothetical protein
VQRVQNPIDRKQLDWATASVDSAIACVHRTMNERRAGSRLQAGVIACECECHRAECGENFEVAALDYEAVRSQGRRFVVVHDHRTADELLITSRHDYDVIEKIGDKGRLAQSLDQR